MAAIVQSNPYQVLSRKIGYSVGLEYLCRNVKTLVEFYSRTGRVSLIDWRTMVDVDFGRKGQAYEHIANFYSTLNLIKIIGNELHPLYGLDVLSIIRRYLHDDTAFDIALRIALSHFVIEADGDIFLNALSASFDREETRKQISAAVEAKWGLLRNAFVNPAIQSRIWDLVSIRSQPATKSGSSEKKSEGSPFAKRTQPLSMTARRPESASEKYVVDVPDSYLDKIIPTRKKWAEDFAYFDSNGLTPTGATLLRQFAQLGMKTENGAMAFWPYSHELAPLRIDYKALKAIPIENWNVLCALAVANGASISDKIESENELLDFMKTVFDLYRTGSAARGSIRHQVPIYVMKPVLVSIFTAEHRSIPPLPVFIDSEIRGTTRRFDVTNVRGTEGALVFRENAK